MKKYIAPKIICMEIGDIMSGFDIVSQPTDAEQLVNENTFEQEEKSTITPKSVWE